MNIDQIKTIIPIILFIILSSCTGSTSKKIQWQPVDNGGTIVCNLDNHTSSILFISKLKEITYPTNLAPESIMSLSAEPQTANNFIIHKRLRRYIPSLNDYFTISSLNILIHFQKKDNHLYLVPIKKTEHQVSVIGSWPIPKMDMIELINYFGYDCHGL